MKNILFAVLAVGTVTCADQAWAAPPENANPALAPWFLSLKQPGNGIGCCSEADCRVRDYRTNDDGYEVLIDDKWMRVPADRVLHNTGNPTGGAVACYLPALGILCFVPGAEI